MKSLVAMNENLKKQEQEFKAHCKEEMNRLKGNIEKLKAETDVEMSDDKVYEQHFFYFIVTQMVSLLTLYHTIQTFNGLEKVAF